MDTLEIRKKAHKCKSNMCNSKILFDEYGFDNCIFTVLEECNEEQGSEREQHYIQNTPNVVNKKGKWIGTKQEYNRYYAEINKDKLSEKYSQYRETHRDILNEKAQAHYHKNIEVARERAKAYREKNREMLKEKQRAYYAKKKSME